MLVLYDILTLTAGDSDANGAPCPPALIAINVAIIPLFVLTFLFRYADIATHIIDMAHHAVVVNVAVVWCSCGSMRSRLISSTITRITVVVI